MMIVFIKKLTYLIKPATNQQQATTNVFKQHIWTTFDDLMLGFVGIADV